MPVPNQFANATTAIPLSQLDQNFNTAITIGNTAVQLGNTITTMNNLNLVNVTVTSAATAFPNSLLANSNVVIGNTTATLGSTVSSIGNLTLANANITSVSPAFPNSFLANSNVTIGNTAVSLGGTISTLNNINLVNATVTSVTTPITTAQGGTGATSLSGANIAVLNASQTFTASERGTVTNANTAAFDMNTTNNFACTPNANVTISFANITAGQSGYIVLVNGNNYAITANASVKVASGALTTLSSNGTYVMSYFAPNSSVVYLTNSAALS